MDIQRREDAKLSRRNITRNIANFMDRHITKTYLKFIFKKKWCIGLHMNGMH